MRARSVIVVGGGIAGIACALRLAEQGVRVTLVETRKKLGGRATSFVDPRSGIAIDNCQHVAMGCCTNYLDLCARLGVLDRITFLREIHWIEEGGRISTMRPSPLPAPAHLAPSFLGVKFLSLREKWQAASALASAVAVDRRLWRNAVFADWLTQQRQPKSLVERFWTPIVVSACNLPPERVCAATALHVFQEGFLAHRHASAIGVATVPLGRLYDSAEPAIVAAGGSLLLGTGVERINLDHVVTSAGETMTADTVVCAVPPERAVRLIGREIQESDDRFAPLHRITHSPILGVHLAFDRPVLPMHSAVLVDRPTQWLFRKHPPDEAESMRGSRVHAVISAADEWIPLDEPEIARRVMADLHACLPGSRGAIPISVRAVKEKLATFAPTPEVESLRPSTRDARGGGLILAGDYVQTGWPATMEGAARSGYLAAAAALGLEPSALLQPSLPTGRVVRLLGMR